MVKKWSIEEENLLRENYPLLGVKVLSLFPTRSKSSVLRKASWMSLKIKKGLRNAIREDISGFLDIECSQLNADFGIIYSWVIKYAGQNKYESAVITREEIMDGTLDKRVCQELIEALKKFTVIMTFYGTNFDIKFIRTRCLINNIPFVVRGDVEHKDVSYLEKRCLRLHSGRLESVCDALGVVGKTRLDGRYWILANSGNPEALKYIFEHNKADTVILEKVYEKLVEFEAPKMRWV